MRTLFLNPPSFEGFDGGASSRWPASREIESYWYPVWLCYPAGMLPDSKVVDALPWVTKVYKRDLDITRYNVPFLLNPFLSFYTSRGCPALCTFCLWPQTHSGHRWRLRSSDDVANEVRYALEQFPNLKEIFFDDDTFNYRKES